MTNTRSHLVGKRPAMQSSLDQTPIPTAPPTKPIGDDGRAYHLELLRLTRCAWGINEYVK